uniref:Probable serine/threonine-protein kinase pats1 n=1 Tax=Phallusia mammillata TaxID=59560 RepID=A0A6F9DL95_9ASCI|nr:probable serine/threonine-protein kinase pats1 [Phallusia mammillata]
MKSMSCFRKESVRIVTDPNSGKDLPYLFRDDHPQVYQKNVVSNHHRSSSCEILNPKDHVDHPSIIKRLGTKRRTTGDRSLMLEAGCSVTLHDVIQRKQQLSWLERCYIAMQLADALSHFHSKSICFGDITSKNVFLTSAMQVKILEPNRIQTLHLTKVGVNRQIKQPSNDIYSYAMVLWELITKKKIPTNTYVYHDILASVDRVLKTLAIY